MNKKRILEIDIEMDGAAFEFDALEEAERIIKKGLNKMDARSTNEVRALLDSNGNTVGEIRIREDEI